MKRFGAKPFKPALSFLLRYSLLDLLYPLPPSIEHRNRTTLSTKQSLNTSGTLSPLRPPNFRPITTFSPSSPGSPLLPHRSRSPGASPRPIVGTPARVYSPSGPLLVFHVVRQFDRLDGNIVNWTPAWCDICEYNPLLHASGVGSVLMLATWLRGSQSRRPSGSLLRCLSFRGGFSSWLDGLD